MKKPLFIPSGEFESTSELPHNLEDAHRLLEQFREYHASLEVQAAQLQSMLTHRETVGLAKKLRSKNNLQMEPKKTPQADAFDIRASVELGYKALKYSIEPQGPLADSRPPQGAVVRVDRLLVSFFHRPSLGFQC